MLITQVMHCKNRLFYWYKDSLSAQIYLPKKKNIDINKISYEIK